MASRVSLCFLSGLSIAFVQGPRASETYQAEPRHRIVYRIFEPILAGNNQHVIKATQMTVALSIAFFSAFIPHHLYPTNSEKGQENPWS